MLESLISQILIKISKFSFMETRVISLVLKYVRNISRTIKKRTLHAQDVIVVAIYQSLM